MEELIRSKWSEILDLMKAEYEISNVAFKTWLKPIEIYSVDESTNTVVLINTDEELGIMGTNRVKTSYNKCFEICIEELTGYSVKLDYKTITDNDISSNSNSVAVKKTTQPISFKLNDKYTFDTFVVGSGNKIAHAASLSVAESPMATSTYNPLFIYGGPGLGKTHLVHSIAHYILENFPGIKVLYTTSSDYIDEIVQALRFSNNDHTILDNIKAKYRDVDVLIIDDVQFIIGKERTQEEFFNTFNDLYSNGKRIILTSDKHPNQLNQLDERYRSRFTWGLPVDIQSPDYETRLAILRDKSKADNIYFDDVILQYLAENITSNIRDLEGAYNKLIFHHKLTHEEITLETAKKDVKDLILSNEKVVITNDYIVGIVAEHYGVTLDDICSSVRRADISLPRQMCMYLCKVVTKSTDDQIGQVLHKDRSTVIHGFKKIKDLIINDPSIQKDVDILLNLINYK